MIPRKDKEDSNTPNDDLPQSVCAEAIQCNLRTPRYPYPVTGDATNNSHDSYILESKQCEYTIRLQQLELKRKRIPSLIRPNEGKSHLSSARAHQTYGTAQAQATNKAVVCVWRVAAGTGPVQRRSGTRCAHTEHTEQERGERRARSAVSRQDFIRTVPSAGGGRGEGVALDCPGVTWPRPAPPSKVP
jgi:hypothetical protein